MRSQRLQFSAVIFDMDGLMLDTERIAQQAWRRAAAEWDYELPDEVYLLVVGRTRQDTEILFYRALGPEFPFREIYDRKQQYVLQIIAEQGIQPKPGLLELLDLLDRLGSPKAVATSTARPLAMQKLAMAGLNHRFKTIICGNEVANGKPAPDIYLAAAKRLQVSAAACLVLEDSEAGAKAAHAAGMTAIIVPDLKQPSAETASLAYKVLPSLRAVYCLLRDQN